MMMKIARMIEFSENFHSFVACIINKYQLLVFHQHRNRPEQHTLNECVVRVLHTVRYSLTKWKSVKCVLGVSVSESGMKNTHVYKINK